MERWRGKVAVVTGASSGIGAQVAVSLANAGLIVIGLARRQHHIQELADTKVTLDRGGRLHALKCDVADEADVKEAFAWIRAHHTTVHLLVNNAGIMSSGFLIDGLAERRLGTGGGGGIVVDEGMDRLRRTLDVNVTAACVVIREAIQLMLRTPDHKAQIILVNSVLGHRIPDVPVPLFNIYPATKFALNGLAQTFRQELRFLGSGIKFTCISPGMVDTDMLTTAFRSGALDAVPKLRTEDVAEAVLYVLGTPAGVQVNDLILEAVPVSGLENGSNSAEDGDVV